MKKLFFIGLLTFSAYHLCACTTFLIHKNGQLAFGRNFDWITGTGMLCTNHRGLAKTSLKMPEGKPVKWVSKYGSITFNQYGKEFPLGGMNEMGLVVEMMWLDGTEYPKPDKRASMHVLQWIQYQLDNFTSVKEVIGSNKKIRISQRGSAPVHYLIADASGQAATIEFLNGKMVVHSGDQLPLAVLANTAYATSSRLVMDVDINNDEETNFEKSASYSDNSVKRFASACAMVKRYQQTDVQKSIVDYSFDVLDKVNQPEFTKWSIVYDINNKVVYFKSSGHTDVKSVAFSQVDLGCTSAALSIDLNQDFSGSVVNKLVPFSREINLAMMSKAVNESKPQVPITDEDVKSTVAYASSIKCSGN